MSRQFVGQSNDLAMPATTLVVGELLCAGERERERYPMWKFMCDLRG